MTTIRLKRAYEAAAPGDGLRVLVERLWPRGVAKQQARIDLWAKDVAPSTELRRWYAHEPERWPEFKRRYRAELKGNAEALKGLRDQLEVGPVTFVFAARDEARNSAVVLKQYLEQLEG